MVWPQAASASEIAAMTLFDPADVSDPKSESEQWMYASRRPPVKSIEWVRKVV